MSEPRFTRGEYWLLETAVEGMPPLRWLVAPNIAEKFNKTGHGLARGALVDTIERLVAANLLCAHRSPSGSFAPTRAEIEAALSEPSDSRWATVTHYGLTPAGGAAWEAFAAPHWDRFFDCAGDEDDRWEAVSANLRVIHQYIALLRRTGDFDESSLVWDEVAPWQATYWKQLPHGHRARFVWREAAEHSCETGASWNHRWYQWG